MKGILIAFLIATASFFFLRMFLTQEHSMILSVIVFLVVLWTNEALPLGVVSLLPLILFPILGLQPMSEIAPNYSKPIIFLFLGGFLLAIAIEKTQLHKLFSQRILSGFAKTPRGVIYSLSFISAFLSSILSNTTVTLMLLPIALHLSESAKLKPRFLLSVAYGASIGGIITPIGTPPNLILLGFLESSGLSTPSFFSWFFQMLPIAALMLLIVPYLLSINLGNDTVYKFEKSPMNKEQKKLFYLFCALVFLLLINSPIKPFYNGLGLNEKLILLGFGLILFFPGFNFLTWKDAKNIPYEIIFLFGAGFSIASVTISSGLANTLTDYIFSLSSLHLFLVLVLIALFVSFSTEITSNTALASVAIPVFYNFAINSGLDYKVITFTATIAASYAFMLPIATPPNAIVMSSRAIKVKDMAKIGFFINILGVLILSTTAYFLW